VSDSLPGEVPIRCSECRREVDEFSAIADRWGFWSDGCGELLPFCPACARREFATPEVRRITDSTTVSLRWCRCGELHEPAPSPWRPPSLQHGPLRYASLICNRSRKPEQENYRESEKECGDKHLAAIPVVVGNHVRGRICDLRRFARNNDCDYP